METLPYCIGWYNGHAVRIFENPEGDTERPWRVAFDPIEVLPGEFQRPPDERERTLGAAKNTALALLRNVYMYYSQPAYADIEWRLIRDA